MKTLLRLVLLGVIVYLLYTSGVLSRLLELLPTSIDPSTTPEINVTIHPIVIESSAAPAPISPTSTTLAFPTSSPVAAEPTTLPLTTETPLPPPTIIIPEPPPTLGAAPTPTASAGFTIVVETPRDGETLRVSPALIIGQTQPDALVSANDVVGFANAEGRFSLSVPLQAGPNILEVLASNAAGEQVFTILTVLYQP